ncbi:MAG: hypothetical protein JO037_23450 [Actinobacteria bacterium]|nr:hypothetical protein [Actinomycetota bacterium]
MSAREQELPPGDLPRDLIEAVGDALGCEYTPGNGRTVIVTLPAAPLRRDGIGTKVPGPGDADTCRPRPAAVQT